VDVGVGHASPVVVGDRVFLFSRQGDEEVLEAFEAATGKRVWRQAYPAPYSMSMAAFRHGKGPKSTPVVADGRIVTFGISGILSAHDAATGRLLWRKDFSREHPATSPTYGTAQSPVVDKGLVIAHVGGTGGGALTAFDAATGAVKWSWKGDGPGYGSPVVADIGGTRQVVTFTQTLLAGVSADTGQLLWKLPFTTDYEQNAVTPIVSGNMVVFSGLDQPLKAVRIVQRAGQWRPEILWENADVAAYMSTPVVAGGRLIGHSHKKKGQFFAVDLATGKTVWLSEGRQGDNAALVAVGDTVLALVTDGEIVVLDAKGPAYAEKRRYDVADTPTWAHLAVTGQGVLVKDEKSLSLLRF
jgi:outer membrane protein assembly factor BamB